MVSFTETFQNVDKLHAGDYVNLDKLQGGLMLSGACSKRASYFSGTVHNPVESFCKRWKLSEVSPLPISTGLPEIFMSHLLNSTYAMTFAVFLK